MTHKQWLYRNTDIHYVSEGLTLRQHKELRAKIKVLMKTKSSALLGRHQHYLSTNFDELGRGPTLACQVWVANIEMAISVAKVAKGNFCTHETLRQLRIPLAFPPTNHHHQILSPMLVFALLDTYTIHHSPHQGHTHDTLGYPRLCI